MNRPARKSAAALQLDAMAYAKSIVEAVEQGCTYEDRCLAVRDWLARVGLGRPVGEPPVGYICAEILSRKREFAANGIVMFDRPCGTARMALYAHPPASPPADLVELVTILHQYRSDMLRPPAPDSRERRVAMIDAAIAKFGSKNDG